MLLKECLTHTFRLKCCWKSVKHVHFDSNVAEGVLGDIYFWTQKLLNECYACTFRLKCWRSVWYVLFISNGAMKAQWRRKWGRGHGPHWVNHHRGDTKTGHHHWGSGWHQNGTYDWLCPVAETYFTKISLLTSYNLINVFLRCNTQERGKIMIQL